MVTKEPPDLLEQFMVWAELQPTVMSVALFGSRARAPGAIAAADGWSDLDLHVATTRPERFVDRDWIRAFVGRELLVHTVRPASGGVIKVTAIFRGGGEVDAVVVPAFKLRLARAAVALGLHRRAAWAQRGLAEMATVMRGGHRVLKGGAGWEKFYARTVAEVRGTRLDDREVRSLADEFLCDWLWVRQKLERGEHVAAQRVLHRSLVEINIRLLHEWRLRRGEPSYREARRIEQLVSAEELAFVAVDARLDSMSLRAASERCAVGFRALITALVPDWRWPDLK